MAVTLHIDLLNTSLEDFAEHFERDFARLIRYAVSADHFTWGLFDHVREAVSFQPLTPNHALVRAIRRNEGSTHRSWMVSKAEIDQPLELLFVLVVTRYRQDRLKIVLDDWSEDEEFEEIHGEGDQKRVVHKRHKEALLKWIEPRWGGEGENRGYTKQDPSEAPQQEQERSEEPRIDIQLKTTAAAYAITKRGSTQTQALDSLSTNHHSLKKYREKGWLLTEEEFKRITGRTIDEYIDDPL